MGLSLYYTLSLREAISMDVVLELVRRTGQFARKIGCMEVGEPLRAEEDGDEAWISFPTCKPTKDGNTRPWYAKPTRGWLFIVWPGEGCETAEFGLCQYPRRVCLHGRDFSTGFKGGWHFEGACKTQYAGEHGWENFLKCHRLVISLLHFWRNLGMCVKVSDEGGFWETRSIEKLRCQFDRYNCLVAAMSGMLKDADGDLSIESPIFDYKDFERLEHEGWREFGGRIKQLQEKLGELE